MVVVSSGGPGVKPLLPHASLTLPPPSPSTYTWRDSSDRALRLSWNPPTGVARVALRGGWVAGLSGGGGGESGPLPLAAVASASAGAGAEGEGDALSAFIHHAYHVASTAPPPAAATATTPPTSLLAPILRSWVGGRTGGAPEAHLRKANTLAWYTLRHALYTTLLSASEGSTKEAVAAWEKARQILGKVVHLPTNLPAAAAAAAPVEGGGGSGEVMVGTLLVGDCVGGGGTLPWIDAGLCETRWSVRQGAARALFGCFDAAVAACELVHGGGGGGKGGDSSAASAASLKERVIQGVTGGTQALEWALGSVFSPVTYPLPSLTTATPFHPALIAEGCMLLHNVCTLTNLALGVASLGVALKLMGRGAGGEAPQAPSPSPSPLPPPPTTTSTTAPTPSPSMALVMSALEAGSERVRVGLSQGVAFLGEVKGGLGPGDKGLQGAVCGAWSAAHSALSPLVRGDGGGVVGEPTSASASSPLPGLDLMPPGPGREWVEEGESSRGVAVKRALNDALNVSLAAFLLFSFPFSADWIFFVAPAFKPPPFSSHSHTLIHTHAYTLSL